MQEDQQQLHSFVYSKEVVDFVRAANETATFFEELKGKDGRTFISELVKHLSEVYYAMLKVGDTEPVLESGSEPTVSEQDWAEIFQRIATLLGPHNEFLRPAEEGEFDDSDLVTHTISEDQSDVYQELRDFTAQYSRGLEEIMNDAVWEVKVRFTDHWGKKLLRSLSSLHDLYVAGVDPTLE
ncbi:MAG: DUF5063 domain-containing protein [Bacteroidetes bacterium]|nr:DUF5063 domain-containing protein [Bacteroidota bacterium]